MSEEVYLKLAQRLDAIPNGFPSTESGVELRILAKLYRPEEAALAAALRLTPEPAGEIAARAGLDPHEASEILKDMVRKGLIRAARDARGITFGLMPFVVGIYEAQLPRLDAELAALMEQYFLETKGGLLRPTPSLHRIIPVEQTIPFDLEIYPYERASALIEGAQSWSVRDCICRVQQRLIGKGCERPDEVCLAFAPIPGAFDHTTIGRAITKQEALDILRQTEEAGLVHSTANHRDGLTYICNCCTCCCGIMRGVAEFDIPSAIARSDFFATVDAEACAGCGDCLARCQFGALTIPEEIATVDPVHCVGCGLCTTVCPGDALRLSRRPASEVSPLPAGLQEWALRRAQNRHISLLDVE